MALEILKKNLQFQIEQLALVQLQNSRSEFEWQSHNQSKEVE